MGLGGLVNGIMGATGNSPKIGTPNPTGVGKDFSGLLQAYINGQPDILTAEQTYKPQYAKLEQSLLPGGVDALRKATPGASSLIDKLTQSASEQLNSGANLDPALRQVTEQSLRGGQAARGLGFGPSDAVTESTALTGLGNTLRQQRQGFAGSTAALGLSSYLPAAMQMTGSAGPTIVNPSAVYDMFNTAYNAKASSNIANQNAQVAQLSGFNSVD